MIRLDPNEPSLTVTGFVFNKFVHPFEDRFITPREAARLQGFPDDLEFKGTLTSVQRQVGDAVPIELGEALFRSLTGFVQKIAPNMHNFKAISFIQDLTYSRGNEGIAHRATNHMKLRPFGRKCMCLTNPTI